MLGRQFFTSLEFLFWFSLKPLEKVALSSVEPFLEDGLITVGIRVSVQHLSATPVDMKVKAEAELTELKERHLIFKVVAYDEREVIGSGMHEHYIIFKKSFLARVADK